MSFTAMLQDNSLDGRGSPPTSSPRAQAQFPSPVGVFPPDLDNPAQSEQGVLDWLKHLSNGENTGLSEGSGGSSIPSSQTSDTSYHYVEQLPSQPELFSLSSPVWSTREVGFGSPAYALAGTPVSLYSTPVLGTQDLHPYPTPPTSSVQQPGGDSDISRPAHVSWALSATVSSSATVVADARTRDVTDDTHATRHPGSPHPRLSSSFSFPMPNFAHDSNDAGLRLELYQPMPARVGGTASQTEPSVTSTLANATAPDNNSTPNATDGQFNGTGVASGGAGTKRGTRRTSSPRKKVKSPYATRYACSLCSGTVSRLQDLPRHNTSIHLNAKPWVCCGVPIEDAAKYEISADAVAIGPMEHDTGAGKIMTIGGCGHTFKRKDTYMHHLRGVRYGRRCVGNPHGWYHKENGDKARRFLVPQVSLN